MRILPRDDWTPGKIVRIVNGPFQRERVMGEGFATWVPEVGLEFDIFMIKFCGSDVIGLLQYRIPQMAPRGPYRAYRADDGNAECVARLFSTHDLELEEVDEGYYSFFLETFCDNRLPEEAQRVLDRTQQKEDTEEYFDEAYFERLLTQAGESK